MIGVILTVGEPWLPIHLLFTLFWVGLIVFSHPPLPSFFFFLFSFFSSFYFKLRQFITHFTMDMTKWTLLGLEAVTRTMTSRLYHALASGSSAMHRFYLKKINKKTAGEIGMRTRNRFDARTHLISAGPEPGAIPGSDIRERCTHTL